MTPEQEEKLKKALGDGSVYPDITDDPEVNYEIDRKVADPEMPPWSEASEDMKHLYQEEVKEVKRRIKFPPSAPQPEG